MHTTITNWEVMRDLQRASILASIPDADIPSDYAIYSVLHTEAIKAGGLCRNTICQITTESVEKLEKMKIGN